MESKADEYIPINAENEPGSTYQYAHRSNRRSASTSGRSAFVLDAENSDVICIGSKARGAEPSKPKKKKVTFADIEEDNEVEWIIPDKTDKPVNVYVIDDDDELDDCNYSLQIPEDSMVIDVESEYSAEPDCRSNPDTRRFSRDNGTQSAKNNTNTITVYADVHTAPASSSCSSATSSRDDSIQATSSRNDDIIQESEIDNYDTRMRACFALDLDVSTSTAIESDVTTGELSRSADDTNVSTSEIYEVQDDSDDDDCILTSMEISTCSSDTKLNSSCKVSSDVKPRKRKLIEETNDEIFRRMMPSAVPGVLSLFAADRSCLPQNIRPSKFCYYYFVSSHIVVKEIVKQEFYKLKEQIMVAKRSNAPPKCMCLTHPLNQNASKLTLLTNPHSLFHTPNCHFAHNSKNSATKRKGLRRLAYQVSLHRIPQKREGKDFKDWSDIVIKRKARASCDNVSSSSNWSNDVKDNEKSSEHRSPLQACKTEPIDLDSSETIAIKMES